MVGSNNCLSYECYRCLYLSDVNISMSENDSYASENVPTGASYKYLKNGWFNYEIFVVWLIHFQTHVKSSETDPALLILDNHSS